jgi:hypothetical protein
VAVKILMSWDILTGREQEYFEFVVRDFIPGMQKMGVEASDAWFTVYGNRPQILAALQMPDVTMVRKILNSAEWKELTGRLLDYVENYEYKIVQARAGFQL